MNPSPATRWWPPALTLAERAAATHQRRQFTNRTPTPEAAASDATGSPAANRTGSARLQRWRSQRPFDRPDFFSRRLGLDRMSEAEFETLLGASPDAIANGNAAPAWVADVERANAVASELARLPRAHVTGDANGLEPVRAFVEPFVSAALARLHAQARDIRDATDSRVFDPLHATRLFEPSLWGQLMARAMKVVILELNVARVQGTLVGDTAEERCACFAEQLRAGRVRDQVIEEYPVLARSLVTAAQFWEHSATEFLRHLVADVDVLRDTFLDGKELGVLKALTTGAGDAHRQGRSVIVVEFSSGARLVYKPRSLSVDRHFHQLIDWINERGQTPPLRAVRAITVDGRGWAEFVPNTPCESVDEVARFYERFGAYLAVLHAVEATDFHYENVIASGEHPMLIDLEALFHPRPDLSAQASDPEWLGWAALQASVLRAGVLPFRAYDTDKSSGFDMSAVGGGGGQRSPSRFPVLVAQGTDEMRLDRDFVQLPESQNRPALGGQAVDPARYARRVLAGFTATYRLLMAHRRELVAPDGPIRRFANDDIRVVLRPTRQYALLLSESHHPDVLRDAVERDRLIDRLWVAVPARPELEQIINWEHADLVNGDVPLLTSRPGSRDLFTTHGASIVNFFRQPGLACAIERIESMSEDDLLRQRWIVEASLVALFPGSHDNASGHAQTAPAVPPNAKTAPSTDDVVDAACLVANRLATLALRSDEHTSWLGLTLIRERDWVVQPVGIDLYGGTLGIAFFLAHLDHVVGHSESRTLARRVVDQVVHRVRATLDAVEPNVPVPPGSLGAFGALGGAVYALSHLGALWNDHALVDLADRSVATLADRVDEDPHLDVVGGAAGYIMATAALERCRPGGPGRSAMRRAALALLDRTVNTQLGIAWTTKIAAWQPLTGLSHGASGIALALFTAGRLLDEPAFIDAALDALRYERNTLDRDRQNWPDYRILDDRGRPELARVMWAWCHGAPGIGLVRLAALRCCAAPEVVSDLDVALNSTACHGFGGNDSLCHGDLGNLELLTMARERGHRGAWEARLVAESARLVERLGRGEWRCGIPGAVETPGLMMGLAGIGYGLLRVAYPGGIPSLLALDPPRLVLSRRAHA